MTSRFENLTKDQLETLAMYTEIKIAKHENSRTCATHPSKTVQDILTDVISTQRAQERAIEDLAYRLWELDLWHMWLDAPDDFIEACKYRMHDKH